MIYVIHSTLAATVLCLVFTENKASLTLVILKWFAMALLPPGKLGNFSEGRVIHSFNNIKRTRARNEMDINIKIKRFFLFHVFPSFRRNAKMYEISKKKSLVCFLTHLR